MYIRQTKHITLFLLATLVCVLTACTGTGTTGTATPTPASPSRPSPTLIPSPGNQAIDSCPLSLKTIVNCQTPHSMQVAYGMESLLARGITGQGQTVVDIVSYGSPSLQQDMDVFDQQFHLPAIKLQIMAPIGSVPFDSSNSDMFGWATETTLDVEIIHAMAPGANIVVLTSPVDETEGTIGLPEFLKLEQYAVNNNLGQIFSQSYVASEVTLADQAGHQLVQTYTNFYQDITTKKGWTSLSGSGDHGATDYSNIAATKFSSTPIVNFPADVPWVTSVGGTTLINATTTPNETAWGSGNGASGDGFSNFFGEPDFQKSLPQSVQTQLHKKRGIPDIAANASPRTAMAIYFNGQWQQIGGTSAATPTWAGIIAVANQLAGHPLGFINAALYKIAASNKASTDFRDVTSGNNSFTQGNLSVTGYDAVAGWDPVTGLGAPIGDQLLPDLITTLNA